MYNKFISLLSCLNLPTVNFTINENSIECVTEDIKFKYFLLDDDILKVPSINIQKIKELEYETNFLIPKETVSSILKASSFTTETEKIYIKTEGTKIESICADAFEWINNATNKGDYDIIIVDVNYTEEDKSISPPWKFLETEFQ